MKRKNPLVSISVVTYNGLKYLKYCFSSIFSQSYSNIEILVLDNNSTDGTADWLKNLKPRNNLRIIFSRQNLGFAKGHNQVIKESRGEFVLCLNQDAVLDKDFVRTAIETFTRDRKTGAIQGKLYRWQIGMPASQGTMDYQVSRVIDTTGLIIFKNRRIINREQGQIDLGNFNRTEEVFGVDGAAAFYRRQMLEDIKIPIKR